MPKSCEVVEIRNSADADGFPCSRTASTQCFDVGVRCVNRTRKHAASVTAYSVLRACPSIQRSTRKPPQQTTGNVGNEKGLKTLAELRLPQPSRQAVACPSCSGRPHILRLNTPDGCPSPLLFFNCTTTRREFWAKYLLEQGNA